MNTPQTPEAVEITGTQPARRLYETLGSAYPAAEQAASLGHYARGDTFMKLELR